jgi:hypothetical protein
MRSYFKNATCVLPLIYSSYKYILQDIVYKIYLQKARSQFHNATSIIPLTCSKSQPDEDPIGSKHVSSWIFHRVVFDGYLFTPFLINTALYSIWTTSAINFKEKRA